MNRFTKNVYFIECISFKNFNYSREKNIFLSNNFIIIFITSTHRYKINNLMYQHKIIIS